MMTNQKFIKTGGSHIKFLVFSALFIIFVGPLIAAWGLYVTRWFVPATVNHGTLLQPSLPLRNFLTNPSQIDETNTSVGPKPWLLIALQPSDCQQNCQKRLYDLRQIQIALGKNQDRVQRVILTTLSPSTKNTTNAFFAKYPGYQRFYQTPAMYLTLENLLKSKITTSTSNDGQVLIADPAGALMMFYSADQNARGIFKDLKRLLAVSG